MGNKFEVWVYVADSKDGYVYDLEWRGEHLIQALWVAYKAKRRGIGCVKVMWRG